MLAQARYFQETISNNLPTKKHDHYNVEQLKKVLNIYAAEEKRIQKVIKDTNTITSATDEVSKSINMFIKHRDSMRDEDFS